MPSHEEGHMTEPLAEVRKTDALIAQLKEFNERSRTYGRQFWQVPFAYLAGAGIAVMQATDRKYSPLVLPLTLIISGVVGIFVVCHLAALCCAANRSYRGIVDVEKQLSLSAEHTEWSPWHLYAFLALTVLTTLVALVAGAYLLKC
jgi:hypothetical protein